MKINDNFVVTHGEIETHQAWKPNIIEQNPRFFRWIARKYDFSWFLISVPLTFMILPISSISFISFKPFSTSLSNSIWLMVGPPLWKIWVRQLGWSSKPKIHGKIKFMATSHHQPSFLFHSSSFSRWNSPFRQQKKYAADQRLGFQCNQVVDEIKAFQGMFEDRGCHPNGHYNTENHGNPILIRCSP